MRPLKTGRISLYLDHYPPIIHPESGKITRWEYLDMYLYNPPRDEMEKRHNKDMETLARSIASNRQLDRLAGKFGIKRSSQFDDFLPFYEKQMECNRQLQLQSFRQSGIHRNRQQLIHSFRQQECR
jgi:hypothetical protein